MQPSREIRLAARPQGEPKQSDFELAEVELPDPGDGEVLVRNLWMSVDPYMRGRMNDVKSYVPPFQVGAALEGGAVGEVVASNDPSLSEGDLVLHMLGWREHAVLAAGHSRKIDASLAPAQSYLGVLGMPGLTAYAGLLDVGGLKDEDIVFISGAAGAVGSLAGQIAKQRGHTVIGSAGSPEKVAHVTDTLGFDAAFNYRDGRVRDLLRQAAPKGIDLYFDNVGGEHLEAAIDSMRLNGRVAMCGMVAQYNSTEPTPGPNNLVLAIGKRINMRGFIVTDHGARMKDLIDEVGGYLRDGKIHAPETVMDGLESAPDAFIGLLRGENTGKMLVKL
jgi:NADPH-dependent curcumin reductase CurA